MDLWVVAAIAGAGCLARYFNKLSNNVDGSSPLSLEDSYFENDVSPIQPFCTQTGRDALYRRASDVDSEYYLLGSDEGLESEKVGLFRNCSESDVLSVSNFNDYGNEQGTNVVANCGFLPYDLSAGKLGHNPHGNRTSHRTKHLYGHISRPSNSLESCLMAQLCEEQVKLEESVFSPSMAIRSFIVGDRNQVIRRANNDEPFSGITGSEEYRLHREANKVKDESALFGLPSLSKITSSNDAKKMKLNAGNGRKISGKHIHTQHEGTYGHSLCDKELNGFSPEKHMDNFPITDFKESYGQKEEESSEAMSKIEAELEAEFEILGLNMNESDPERPHSELVEHVPVFVADFAQAESQTNMIGGKDFFQSELNEEDSATVVPVNYAVSPHELTLRLHEVIQSRLEGRVKELEIALENSQRKLWFMESEHKNHSQKFFPRKASSFSEGNVLACNECEPMTEPLVMNLSAGAYNDFKENSPSSMHIPECEAATDILAFPNANEERVSWELSSGEVTMLEGLSSSNYESNDVTGDENCECDYEMERQLIRQIVERTKKGSPVFQNARRILYSMDKDEH
ncbi:uncharacterized protein LOC114179706 isoform X2 [Vigna unguiculata]|uniref:uncharacterized protein LOC114179706 isoform X2 n=1 Tax=Vigna unguiculata TaxID=3917 RepID=UPI0010166A0E|nr:uncharacterized protein LOC114179706 isoform X2 [Vigna unguiculata]